MADVHILDVNRQPVDDIIVELTDGRALTFSLQKFLTLVPDAVTTKEDAKKLDSPLEA
ncbi:MAG: hypothetical protein ACRYFU_05235 [Janthinobacterium lividum]